MKGNGEAMGRVRNRENRDEATNRSGKAAPGENCSREKKGGRVYAGHRKPLVSLMERKSG